ncbi:G protein-regulated inducer of neurite outgrowth 1 [Pelodiscus sinensis]|uniref:G protein-regulated inducer of neurite outgrowth 1 n=1 Tax=Pelodiscus sinensis TaxID=13735 RepID=UPI003F6C9981
MVSRARARWCCPMAPSPPRALQWGRARPWPALGHRVRACCRSRASRGAARTPGNAPAPLKHVVFLEPAHTGPEPDGAGAAVLSPEQGPVPPTCPQERSQEQPGATERDLSCGNRGAPGAAPLPPGGVGAHPADAGGKAPALLAEPEAQLGSPAAPGAGVKGDPALPSPEGTKEPAGGAPGAGAAPGLGTRADAGQSPLGRAKETGPPAPGSSQPASAARRAGALPEAPAAAPSLKGQGKPGQSRAAPAEAGEGSGPPQSPAPEQQSAPEPGEEAAREGRTAELLSKTYSFELTPPPQDAGTQDAGTQDAGTQAGSRVSLVSVAVSPINPPDGAPAFTFHSRGPLKSPGPGLKPARKDAEMQVSIPVETRSVATGPMTPMAKSPQASYPEVRVKGAQEEPPEPIREVSWDEKGMTWEVYGATMEVEVLGMAIQKHLEKQIEEHGRQTVMTPQSTRASSVKGEAKRQPSMFRALLENLRRPPLLLPGRPRRGVRPPRPAGWGGQPLAWLLSPRPAQPRRWPETPELGACPAPPQRLLPRPGSQWLDIAHGGAGVQPMQLPSCWAVSGPLGQGHGGVLQGSPWTCVGGQHLPFPRALQGGLLAAPHRGLTLPWPLCVPRRCQLPASLCPCRAKCHCARPPGDGPGPGGSPGMVRPPSSLSGPGPPTPEPGGRYCRLLNPCCSFNSYAASLASPPRPATGHHRLLHRHRGGKAGGQGGAQWACRRAGAQGPAGA